MNKNNDNDKDNDKTFCNSLELIPKKRLTKYMMTYVIENNSELSY